jgi:RNA polymerase sigma-70 factor, ECF subfamily
MPGTLSYKTIAAFNKREGKAVAEVWDFFYAFVFSNIRTLTNGSSDTRDLTSETLAILLDHQDHFESAAKIRNFLFITARNKSANHMNRLRIVKAHSEELEKHYQGIEADDLAGAETAASLLRQVYSAIKRLPDKRREVIILYNQGLKNREIAERLGVSQKAVEKRKTIAFKTLKMEFRTSDGFTFLIIFL